MQTRIAALVVSVAVALAGCGGDSDTQAATRIVKRWLHAMAQRDDAQACALLTARLQKLIDLQLRQLGHPTGTNCHTFAARWVFPPSPVGHPGAHIARLHLRGRTGSAELVAPGAPTSTATLLKQPGGWRIDNYQ